MGTKRRIGLGNVVVAMVAALGLAVSACASLADTTTGVAGGTDGTTAAGAEVTPGVEEPGDAAAEAPEDATTTTAPHAAQPEPSPTTPAPATTAKPQEQPQPKGTPARVVKVVDGDTVQVELGGRTESIRIIGIDTPETVHPSQPVQCFGPEASRRAKELLEGTTVGVDYDGTQGRLDKYGRTLAFIWLADGQLYTEVMLREGFAKEYTYRSAYKYLDIHLAAQRSAREQGRGLWSPSTCGGNTSQPDPNAPPPPTTAASSSGGGGGDVYYENCTAARAAGAAPIHRGEPGYRPAMDGDNDGIACE